MRFLGAPYPISAHPRGLLRSQSGIDQIRSDLLVLLLTNPGERVFLPDFGTPLRELLFEPNDQSLQFRARQMIANAIATWEPRITVQSIDVTNQIASSSLHSDDAHQDRNYILHIRIAFFDPENIQDVQQLTLQVPLAGGNNG